MIDNPYIDTLYLSEQWLIKRDNRTNTITVGEYNDSIGAYFNCVVITNYGGINFSTNYSMDDLPEDVKNEIKKEVI